MQIRFFDAIVDRPKSFSQDISTSMKAFDGCLRRNCFNKFVPELTENGDRNKILGFESVHPVTSIE